MNRLKELREDKDLYQKDIADYLRLINLITANMNLRK